MGPAGAVTFHSVFTRAVGTQRPTLTPATMPSLDWATRAVAGHRYWYNVRSRLSAWQRPRSTPTSALRLFRTQTLHYHYRAGVAIIVWGYVGRAARQLLHLALGLGAATRCWALWQFVHGSDESTLRGPTPEWRRDQIMQATDDALRVYARPAPPPHNPLQ